MISRLAPSIASILIAVASITQPVAAQPKPTQPATFFKLVRSFGTTAEAPKIDAVVSRVRTRVEGDAAFDKALEDAYAKKSLATVKSLLAPVAQLPVDQVWAADPIPRTSSVDRASLFRLVSAERYNPFAILVIVGQHGICFGTKDACRAAFKEIGWTLAADQ
jgi:hypothetical protein